MFYLESYLNRHTFPLDCRPLVFACLYLARKYQKGHSPLVEQWERRLSYQIDKPQILELEEEIIFCLDFNIEPTTRWHMMTAIYPIVKLPEKMVHFSSYLLDLSIFLTHKEYELDTNPIQFSKYFSEAEIALSVIHLTCYFFHPELSHLVPIEHLNFNFERIHECSTCLFQLLKDKDMK